MVEGDEISRMRLNIQSHVEKQHMLISFNKKLNTDFYTYNTLSSLNSI